MNKPHVGDLVIRDMRNRFDLLITNCSKYFKRYKSHEYALSWNCIGCTRHKQDSDVNGEPCGLAFAEEQRLLSILRGIGFTDRYQPKRTGILNIRNWYGRIVYKKVKA